MKITFVVPPPNMSGGIKVIAIYADLLTSRGHDVTIVAQRPVRMDAASILKGVARGRWPETKPRPSRFDRVKAKLISISHDGPVRAGDVPDGDVVIATWWETANWVADLPASKGAKAYFVQDYGAEGQELEKIVPTWKLPLFKITIGAWIAGLVSKHVPEAPPVIVLNSVEHDVFDASQREKNTVPTVGFAYRATPSKGIRETLLALEKVRRVLPELKIVSFGFNAPSLELPLPSNATYHRLPADSELSGIYGACDAWIFPSRIEGFGLPVLEAMGCRCPVVATKAGCAPDVLRDGVNGYLVDVGDVDAIAARLLDVLQADDASWRAMSDAAYQTVHGYSWDDACALFEEALFEAVKRNA